MTPARGVEIDELHPREPGELLDPGLGVRRFDGEALTLDELHESARGDRKLVKEAIPAGGKVSLDRKGNPAVELSVNLWAAPRSSSANRRTRKLIRPEGLGECLPEAAERPAVRESVHPPQLPANRSHQTR